MFKKLGNMTGKQYVYMELNFQLYDFPFEIQQEAFAYAKLMGYDTDCCPVGQERQQFVAKMKVYLHEYLQNYVQMIIDTRLKELIANESISSSRA